MQLSDVRTVLGYRLVSHGLPILGAAAAHRRLTAERPIGEILDLLVETRRRQDP